MGMTIPYSEALPFLEKRALLTVCIPEGRNLVGYSRIMPAPNYKIERNDKSRKEMHIINLMLLRKIAKQIK